MERAITGFHLDDEGDWVAELVCGHDQHIRHRPPFQLRPWVLEASTRERRLGAPLECPLCDRAEPPEDLRLVRTTPVWNEETLPRGLCRAHRVAGNTWGMIRVHEGRLRFRAMTHPRIESVIGQNMAQAIPPDVEHEVEPLGAVRLSVGFFAVEREASESPVTPSTGADDGGDPACWQHLVDEDSGKIS